MKKLILLFVALLAIGNAFQSCSNTKTYAEMLQEEKDAINAFIKKQGIQAISKDDFEKDTVTNVELNEYVAFSNGVYMQIVDRGSLDEADAFVNRDVLTVRFIEHDIIANDTSCFNVFIPGFEDYSDYNNYPDVFNYMWDGYNPYGQFIEGSMGLVYGTTDVPGGWLFALKYLRNNAHVRLIVPSKQGHSTAQKYVYPYFYDIRKISKANS